MDPLPYARSDDWQWASVSGPRVAIGPELIERNCLSSCLSSCWCGLEACGRLVFLAVGDADAGWMQRQFSCGRGDVKPLLKKSCQRLKGLAEGEFRS